MRSFDAFGCAEKTLHANPGGHLHIPDFELENSAWFFARHLGPRVSPSEAAG